MAPLTLTRAVIENGNLVVHLDAEYEGIEPFGEKFLVTEQGEIPGRMEIYPDNDVEVTFNGVDRISGTTAQRGNRAVLIRTSGTRFGTRFWVLYGATDWI